MLRIFVFIHMYTIARPLVLNIAIASHSCVAFTYTKQPARNVSGEVAANTCPCISAAASADFAAALRLQFKLIIAMASGAGVLSDAPGLLHIIIRLQLIVVGS